MPAYPRSFLQLVTAGQFAVAIPLLVMAAYAVFALDHLAEHHMSSVGFVAEASRLSGELAEDVVHMEIALRRHEVLADTGSLADYERSRTEWHEHLEAFAALPLLPEALRAEIRAQRDAEEAAYLEVAGKRPKEPLRLFLRDLRMRTATFRDNVQALIQRDKEEIRDKAEHMFNHALLALLVALLATLLVLWLIRRLLARLIGSFEGAVVALGRGNLQHPILLDGPADLRWLGRWLDWLRRRLLSLEQSRTQVLRHVSHELKTPLAAMREGTSLLAENVVGPLNDRQREVVDIVRGNVARLNDLIEGLLRLQQAGHAAERIGHEWLDYPDIVMQTVSTHRLIAQEKQIRFDVALAPLKILAGREALLTVVHNLVANAVKFSPPNGMVKVALAEAGEEGVLTVSDQGPGVPADERAALFQPFFRGRAGKHVPGVGLGLAIAREFVVAHRGEITVDDAPEGGARFTVRLPLRAPYLRNQNNA